MADVNNINTPISIDPLDTGIGPGSDYPSVSLAQGQDLVGLATESIIIIEIPGPPTFEPELPPVQNRPTVVNFNEAVIVAIVGKVLTTSGFGTAEVVNTNAQVTAVAGGALVTLNSASSYQVTSVGGAYLNADVSIEYEIKSAYEYDLVPVNYFYFKLYTTNQSIELGRAYKEGIGHVVYAEYKSYGQIVGFNQVPVSSAGGKFRIVRYGAHWAAAFDGNLLLGAEDLSADLCEVTYGCESFTAGAQILISNFKSEPGVAFGPYLMVNKVGVEPARINGYIPYGSGGPHDVYIFDKSGNVGRVLSGVIYGIDAGQEITSKSGIGGSILGDPSLR